MSSTSSQETGLPAQTGRASCCKRQRATKAGRRQSPSSKDLRKRCALSSGKANRFLNVRGRLSGNSAVAGEARLAANSCNNPKFPGHNIGELASISPPRKSTKWPAFKSFQCGQERSAGRAVKEEAAQSAMTNFCEALKLWRGLPISEPKQGAPRPRLARRLRDSADHELARRSLALPRGKDRQGGMPNFARFTGGRGAPAPKFTCAKCWAGNGMWLSTPIRHFQGTIAAKEKAKRNASKKLPLVRGQPTPLSLTS